MRLAPRRRRFEPDHLFVVTFGRSGSTLVQGLLNAIPGTLVRGENGFFVHDLYRASATAEAFGEKHAKHGAQQVKSAFYGVRWLRRETFARSARQLVHEILLGDEPARRVRRLGFKEVLWHRISADETADFFDWFEEVFPGARYVLNTRDVAAASTSGFWQRQDHDDALASIARVIEVQEFLRSTRPDRVVDVHYEVLTGERAASDAELRRLAQFVTGGCDEALLEKLREVLAVGHGPNPFGKSRRDRTAAGG